MRHYPATTETHGTVDPDTLGPERNHYDRPVIIALFAAYNQGVRRARNATPLAGCSWCYNSASGHCKRHRGES